MNWLTPIIPYIPPFTSICLLAISRISDDYLKKLVEDYHTQNEAIEKHKDVIKDIALDCSYRLGFYNAMFASLISCVSISAIQEYIVALITLVILLVIFFVMFLWIHTYEIGELMSTEMKHFKIRKAAMYDIILFF